MSGSTVANVLLILTIFIASEVSTAPREEATPSPRVEKFAETRDAEVRLARSDENIGETREDEVRQRQARLAVKEPLPPANESGSSTTTTTTTKSNATSATANRTSEATDMTGTVEPVATSHDDRATANRNQPTNPTTTNTDDAKTAPPTTINNATGNVTVSPPPGMIFPPTGYKSINTCKDDKCLKVYNKYMTHSETPGDPASKSNATNNSVEVVLMNSTTAAPTTKNISTASPTTSAATVATTQETTTKTPTTEAPVTTKVTEVATPATTTTTEWPLRNEVITESTAFAVSTEPSKAELQLHSKKVTPMPSGVVALITAIAFAIVAVVAYVGLVAWRRYLEWRYGNRELLVNDFDANDIGNFEL